MSLTTRGALALLLAPVVVLLVLAFAGLTGLHSAPHGINWEDGSVSYPDGTAVCLSPASGCTP